MTPKMARTGFESQNAQRISFCSGTDYPGNMAGQKNRPSVGTRSTVFAMSRNGRLNNTSSESPLR
jgi:hypothetical protein